MAKDSEDKSKSFLTEFKSNMADYFDDNPNAFDFTGKSEPGEISVGEKSRCFYKSNFP